MIFFFGPFNYERGIDSIHVNICKLNSGMQNIVIITSCIHVHARINIWALSMEYYDINLFTVLMKSSDSLTFLTFELIFNSTRTCLNSIDVQNCYPWMKSSNKRGRLLKWMKRSSQLLIEIADFFLLYWHKGLCYSVRNGIFNCLGIQWS